MTTSVVISWLALLGIAACDPELHGPVRPGGGATTTASPSSDAAAPTTGPDAQPGVVVSGRVCPLADLRFPTRCTVQDLEGVLISALDAPAAITRTSPNGAFSLDLPSTPIALVAGRGQVPWRESVVPIATARLLGATIPVVGRSDYLDLVSLLGAVEPDDTASVAIYVRRRERPASGVEVIAPADTTFVYYDSDSAVWDPGGTTESAGAILLLGVPVNEGVAAFDVVDGTGTTRQTVPVAVGATTFVTVTIGA